MIEIARIQLAKGLSLSTPTSRLTYAQSILSGARYEALADRIAKGEFKRILDVGAGAGEFAAWVWSLCPKAWVTCVEVDPELRHLCELNAPPGTYVVSLLLGSDVPWDLVRWASSRTGGATIRAKTQIFDFVTEES